MAPKDYAKRVLNTSKAKKKKTPRMGFILLGGVLLVLAGLGGWIFMHKAEFSTHEPILAQIKNLLHPKVNKQPKINTVTENSEEPVHFDFYNDLPNVQVTVPTVADNTPPPKPKPITKVHDPEAAVHYILDLGMFEDERGAGELRLSLILLGYEVNVIKINSSKGAAYRVQTGPYVTQAEAIKVQKELEKKGFPGAVKKG
jgi:cell division protein FtsN